MTTEGGLSRDITVTQGGAEVSIMVLPEVISVTAEGDTMVVNVTSNGDWTAELTGQAPGFVHFLDGVNSGTGNGNIELVIDKNSSTAVRDGGLKLTATDSQRRQQVKTVAISQAGMVYRLNVDAPEMSQLPSSATTLGVTITCNSSWTATVSSDSFVTLGKEETTSVKGSGNSIIELNVAENTSSSPRTAMLTVIMDFDSSQHFSISITQLAKSYTIVLYRKRVVMPNSGGSFSLGFKAENDWRAEAEKGEWVQLDKHTGSSSDEAITVTVDANYTLKARTDIITFTILEGGYQAHCEVVQTAQGAPVVTNLKVMPGEDGTAMLLAHYESDAENVGIATECGFYYGTDGNDLSGSGMKVNCNVGNGVSGDFSYTLTGLEPSTTYYLQAFAVNPWGIGLSEVKTLSTAGTSPGEDDIEKPDMP